MIFNKAKKSVTSLFTHFSFYTLKYNTLIIFISAELCMRRNNLRCTHMIMGSTLPVTIQERNLWIIVNTSLNTSAQCWRAVKKAIEYYKRNWTHHPPENVLWHSINPQYTHLQKNTEELECTETRTSASECKKKLRRQIRLDKPCIYALLLSIHSLSLWNKEYWARWACGLIQYDTSYVLIKKQIVGMSACS